MWNNSHWKLAEELHDQSYKISTKPRLLRQQLGSRPTPDREATATKQRGSSASHPAEVLDTNTNHVPIKGMTGNTPRGETSSIPEPALAPKSWTQNLHRGAPT